MVTADRRSLGSREVMDTIALFVTIGALVLLLIGGATALLMKKKHVDKKDVVLPGNKISIVHP